jgi:hypothetical protein
MSAVAHDPQRPGEARRFRRYPFPGVVRLNERPEQALRACDLSASGVGLHSREPLGVGRTVEVVLLDSSVRIKGVVRHEAPAAALGWRIGIEFAQPQPELLAVALSLPGGP